MTDGSVSGRDDSDSSDGEVQQFVAENQDLLTRVLAHGDVEARGYALALLANGGTTEDVEQVRSAIDGLTDDGEEQ